MSFDPSELQRLRDRLTGIGDPLDLLAGLFAYAPVGYQVFSVEGHSVLTNRSFRAIFGSEPPPEYNVFEDSIVEERGLSGLIRRAFAGETVQLPTLWYDPRDLTNAKVDEGRLVAISWVAFPLHDSGGVIRYVVFAFRDETSERQALESAQRDRDSIREAMNALTIAQAELGVKEAHLRAVFNGTDDGMLVADDEGRHVDVNRGASGIFGMTQDELLRETGLAFTRRSPDSTDAWHRFIREGRADGEFQFTRPDGSIAEVEFHAVANIVAGRHLAVFRDITERKRAENRQRLLANELDHRVKNNLASVIALAEQTLSSVSSLDEFRASFLGRVTAMADIHSALARSKWESLDLSALLEVLVGPHQNKDRSRITFRGPAIRLPIVMAMPLTLTIHELATNAAKYGALSVAGGSVAIEWAQTDKDLAIEWEERNGPPVTTPARLGSGTLLMQGFISYELKGILSFRYEPTGLRCSIRVPLK